MVMGAQMRRPRTGEWVTGLGIADGPCVLPHHERSNPAEVHAQLQEQLSDTLTILGIDAQTACLGGPGHWKVIGHGKVTAYRPEGWQVYQAGESFRVG